MPNETRKHVFDVRVRTDVAKYLAYHYKSPFQVSRRTKAGRLLLNLLHSPHHEARFEEQIKAYPMLLSCEISRGLVCKRRTRNVSSRTTFDFNEGVADMIRDDLYLFVEVVRSERPGLPYEEIIGRFFARYGFDENDMSVESLLRDLTRRRAEEKKRQEAQNCAPIVRFADGSPRVFVGARTESPANSSAGSATTPKLAA